MSKKLSKLFLLLFIFGTFINIYSVNVISSEIDSLKKTSKLFNQVAEKGIAAVVSISTEKFQGSHYNYYENMYNPNNSNKQGSLGSGVIINKEGYILTNTHVIENVDKIVVTLSDNREYEAKIIGLDKKTDIAVLKIEDKNIPFIKIGKSEKLKPGDWAIAVGNPFGLNGTVTVGVISALGRSETDISDYASLIQTDAAINPGNSGGALLNIDGELIGINTAIYTKSGGYMGIGFAIPIQLAKKVMDDLINKGHVVRGWLGVHIQPVTEQLKNQFNLKNKSGALISEILDESPAELSGLKRGDVIIKVNKEPITSVQDLRSKIASSISGDTLDISFIRNKNIETTQVLIVESPQDKTQLSKPTDLGLTLKNLTESLMNENKITEKEGILITQINTGSIAYKNGLNVGDIILEINQQPINDIQEFKEILKTSKSNEELLMVVKSKGFTHYVVLPVN